MQKLPVYLSLALAVAGLAACEKELEEVAQPQTQTQAPAATAKELLTESRWQPADVLTTNADPATGQPVTVSMFARLKTAQRDNLTQFATDGRYVVDEGLTKANDALPQQTSGTYELSADAKTLTVKLGEQTQTYVVEELTATTLRLSSTTGEGATASTYTTVYKH